jgi:hypothetical protein
LCGSVRSCLGYIKIARTDSFRACWI